VEGTMCDRLTAQAGGSIVDVYPDWRRPAAAPLSVDRTQGLRQVVGALTGRSGAR
jgi:hypothetical protein